MGYLNLTEYITRKATDIRQCSFIPWPWGWWLYQYKFQDTFVYDIIISDAIHSELKFRSVWLKERLKILKKFERNSREVTRLRSEPKMSKKVDFSLWCNHTIRFLLHYFSILSSLCAIEDMVIVIDNKTMDYAPDCLEEFFESYPSIGRGTIWCHDI